MIREVDLASYLPAFMQNYKEPVAALEAENPEFENLWQGAERALNNHFISTADEYGLSRYEKLLDIRPEEDDTLESRRIRVQTRWVSKLPYTWKALTERIGGLCGASNFSVKNDFGQGYGITIRTALEMPGQVNELEHVLEEMVPCNIEVSATNHICCDTEGLIFAGGCVAYTDIIEIEN